MNDLFKNLEQILIKDNRFVSYDGILLKNIIREQTEKLDEKLIILLLENEETKKVFFKNILDVLVFDSKKFLQYLNNKEFLPDSYTSFKNKIGLTNSNGDFIANSNEVVLNFPYKDCILAGGQDKEDVKRDEIFYNDILAREQIDVLLDKKVFTNFKKINKDGEISLIPNFSKEEIKKGAEGFFTRDENGIIKDNLIIKGNNLLALHSLKSNFSNKVKLIYIDPPYNTGNDSFGYNDKFNHSTWLIFMKNRLEIAKELLKDDGVIFVQCDDNEQAYLKVLMDEIFGRENFLSLLPRITKKAGKSTDLISKNHDLILVFFKENITLNRLDIDENNYSLKDEYYKERGGFKLSQTLDYNSLQYNKKMDYEIEINNNKFYPGGIELFEERKLGKFNKIDWVWRWGKDKLKFGLENGFVEIKNNRIYTKTYSNATILKENGEYFIDIVKREKNISSLDFVLNNEFSNDNSTKHIAKIFENKNIFGYSKPEKLIQRIIEISTNPGDIVLDYHLGSGTTCAVAHKMGRQYIGIEQMDYIENITVERMKKVIDGEQGGISKSVNWQGGGEFIYMEIKKSNQNFIDKILNSNSKDELIKIYNEIKESGFINYNIDIQKIDENIKDFEELSITNMQDFLIKLLDKNMLYVNFSELEDENNTVSDFDKKLNKQFYKK